jgi:hypothetical protein
LKRGVGCEEVVQRRRDERLRVDDENAYLS